MGRQYLLVVTALLEAGTGLLAMAAPAILGTLLLGTSATTPESLFLARIAGAALLAIGVACWLGRSDRQGPVRFGLLTGVLIYDVAAAVILAYTGLGPGLVGVMLWPAVALHAALAAWCVLCFRDDLRSAR